MTCLLLKLVKNLGEGINKIKCRYGYDKNKCETCKSDKKMLLCSKIHCCFELHALKMI